MRRTEPRSRAMDRRPSLVAAHDVDGPSKVLVRMVLKATRRGG